jgi:hypothetical protein
LTGQINIRLEKETAAERKRKERENQTGRRNGGKKVRSA